ncbi:YbaN family protein [Marinobacterium weihaiense]|uniref:Inner membrane protein n=1 Tax=Marinobacterium weihaiense TaxID=2851016 RepID=A0ABS6MD94_9GAMM|nr:YbaN family protein [Marinobacterium weihaiense]MBV0933806.1 YbaN family protein [Marinobacterium weihaiense]
MANHSARQPWRWLWLLLTWACIALALLGALLPGLPTTIFVLMAAGCASRCSPGLHRWLQQHRLLGPSLRNWERGGHIDRRTKWIASLGMLTALLIALYTIHHPLMLGSIILLIATGAGIVWSRPEPPRTQHR